MNRADIVASIITACNEAKAKARAYKYITAKRYDYRRAIATIAAYDQALDMFARLTEHNIPNMAIAAEEIAGYTRTHKEDTTEMALAAMDGRRDALATVAEWMSTKESD